MNFTKCWKTLALLLQYELKRTTRGRVPTRKLNVWHRFPLADSCFAFLELVFRCGVHEECLRGKSTRDTNFRSFCLDCCEENVLRLSVRRPILFCFSFVVLYVCFFTSTTPMKCSSIWNERIFLNVILFDCLKEERRRLCILNSKPWCLSFIWVCCPSL